MLRALPPSPFSSRPPPFYPKIKDPHLNHVDVGVGSGHQRSGDQDQVGELGGERRRDEDFENGHDALIKLGIDGSLVFFRRGGVAIFRQKKTFRPNLSPLLRKRCGEGFEMGGRGVLLRILKQERRGAVGGFGEGFGNGGIRRGGICSGNWKGGFEEGFGKG